MLAMLGTESSPLREPGATHLRLRGVEGAVAFYRAAFGAVEFMRLSTPEGRPVHAEMRVQGLRLMLDEGYGRPGPTERLVVDDADSFVERALAMGADLLTPLDDEVYSGMRACRLMDPFGNSWTVVEKKRCRETSQPRAQLREG